MEASSGLGAHLVPTVTDFATLFEQLPAPFRTDAIEPTAVRRTARCGQHHSSVEQVQRRKKSIDAGDSEPSGPGTNNTTRKVPPALPRSTVTGPVHVTRVLVAAPSARREKEKHGAISSACRGSARRSQTNDYVARRLTKCSVPSALSPIRAMSSNLRRLSCRIRSACRRENCAASHAP